MKRNHIRVVPTSEDLSDRDVTSAITTLHSLWADQSVGLLDRLLPTRSSDPEPINYTFHIVSMGKNEAVEMYYHVDNEDHLETLKERLRSIYPSTFSVEEVYTDIVGKLIDPVEYPRDEFLERLDAEELHYNHRQDNRLDMTRILSEESTTYIDGNGREMEVLPDFEIDSQMLNEESRFLRGERVATRINRLDRVPEDGLFNALRRPTVGSLTDPLPEEELDLPEPMILPNGREFIPEVVPGRSRTINYRYLGEAGEKIVDTVYARPPLDELTPVGVRWQASTSESDDWMTSLTRFDNKVYTSASTDEIEAHQGEPPLTTILEQLTKVSQPLAVQIRFSPMGAWTSERQDREDEIEQVGSSHGMLYDFMTGIFRDTSQRYEDDPYYDEPATPEVIDPPEGSHDANRLEMMREIDETQSFLVNMDAFGILGPEQDTPPQEFEDTLNRLTSAFQAFNGPEYKVVGERLGGGFRGNRDLKAEFEDFRYHRISMGTPHFWSRNKNRKDFVLDPKELANFIVVPPTHHLSVEATRGTRANQQTQSPLPRPHSGVMRELRGALEVGHALDQNGHPEDDPVGIPISTLTKHYARLAATGTGKTVAADNDQLSLSRNTSGPMFVIDAKGGDFLENYMRTYQAAFGKQALEENILYFNFPNQLPGISFFDIRGAYTPDGEPGDNRDDAIQNLANHFVEILKIVMGREKFEQAKNAGNIIKYMIKILFDKDHGHKHGHNRKSADVFGYEDLEWLVEQLETAAETQEYHRLPETTHKQAHRRIYNRVTNYQTFSSIMEGVKTRLDYVGQDDNLRRIFNNTSPKLDFEAILDTDKQVLFDLGSLQDDSAEIMTAVLMTTLFDALQERDLSDKPDDYVVNLQIDEAASVVVSKPMQKFLTEGREFRLSLGLMTQFSKQIEHEGSRSVYMNLLNNVRTTLASTIKMDEELAESFSNEDMDATEAKYRLRHMASGEWMINTMYPGWGESQPQPFSIRAMDIPPGHPKGNEPLSDEAEADFQRIHNDICERVEEEYGIIEDDKLRSLSVPPSVQQVVGCSERIGHLLAKATGGVQLDSGGDARKNNDPVRASDVLEKVHDYYEGAAKEAQENDSIAQANESRKEHRPPTYEMVVETARNRTDLIQVAGANGAAEAQMRLTDAGEKAIETDTGNVRSSGGEDHDAALAEIEQEFGSEGFIVNVLEQDGSDMPDAKATHPELDTTLILEAETTTPTKPPKVLENLKKAQRMDGIPVFVVEPGEDDVSPDEAGKHYAYWARRIENILSEPVKKTDDETEVIHYYVSDNPLRINDHVTALRPTTGDKRRTNWTREDGELVMRDGDDTEHVRLSSLTESGTTDFPAVDIYDSHKNKHIVQEKTGEEHTYSDSDDFEDDWVGIKRPAIPSNLLPNPEYDRDDYHVVILSQDDDEQPVFYRDGETFPLNPTPDEPAQTFEKSPDHSEDRVARAIEMKSTR